MLSFAARAIVTRHKKSSLPERLLSKYHKAALRVLKKGKLFSVLTDKVPLRQLTVDYRFKQKTVQCIEWPLKAFGHNHPKCDTREPAGLPEDLCRSGTVFCVPPDQDILLNRL